MRELREDTFFGNKNDDAHEHVEWVDRLSLGTVDSWDLLKKVFIQRYCPPSKTAKQLKEIFNFKQEGDETLYQAWERYNELLYKCPTYDINSHKRVNIFYNGIGSMNRQLLDSQGPIPGRTPDQALTAIQTMADHSQKWNDGSSSRNIDSSSNSERSAAIVRTLTNEVKGRTNGGKFEKCKAIFTEDGSPLYTPFYYSPEEIEYFSASSGFSEIKQAELRSYLGPLSLCHPIILCHPISCQSLDLEYCPLNIWTLENASCHPMIVTACATYVSDLKAKPTNKCAFTMADVSPLESELVRFT
ncbi:hypothetical protein Tco_0985300 [Tanacetum coccineum]